MVYSKKSGHIGGSFSICEIIAYLYSNYDLINEDKIILSKGHAVPAIYAALHELGLIEIDSFREINSPLQGHPDKNRLKYIHATTGSLGQGLSIAIGHALAYKIGNKNKNVFCIVGDGELQEGQIWESFMMAPKHKLNNLICFIDKNGFQNDRSVDDRDLSEKIMSFGWNVVQIDGHNIQEIHNVMHFFNSRTWSVPMCIILNTIKGKGVSFMENNNFWHSSVPSEAEYNKAIEELNEIN